MMPDTDPIDVTSILAQPREFARRYENMQAQLSLAQAERDAARAEVARLTTALQVAQSQPRVVSMLEWEAAALRGDTAPAQAAARDAMIEILEDDPAPAQPDATTLSDNSLQTSSQAPATGRE